MWKDFFYYSRSERRIICLLLISVLVLGAAGIGLWWRQADDPADERYAAEIDSFLQQVERVEKTWYASSKRYPKASSFAPSASDIPVVLQPFDPNTADSLQLRSLGLPAHVARNILRYRAKGGVFRTPASFARIYGMEPELYQTLLPYLRLPQEAEEEGEDSRLSVQDSSVLRKLPAGTIVELNTADTVLLKQIPGIGSARANQIVAYRRRLGGYVHVAQLEEITSWDASLNGWFSCDSSAIQKIQVNRAGLDRLKNHPYMNFYKAKAILEYRRKRGNIKGLSQLSLFQEFTEKDLERLSPYLSFD